MEYKPGKHLIATLQTGTNEVIQKYAGFRDLINRLVDEYKLVKLGEVYHDFSPGGFTAVICLSESHISIHTWPEHQLINVDVYLSNFQRNNDDTVKAIFENIVHCFNATILSEQTITR
ncbi:S-adenosylmethionine decarboxylase family protein [Ferruginibacter sp.]